MSSSKKDSNSSSSLFAFAAGAMIGGAIGTVIGLFLAPKSGTEMRYQLSEDIHEAQSRTRQVLDETKVNFSQSVNKATRNLETTVKKVAESFNAGRKAARENIESPESVDELEQNQADDEKFAKMDKPESKNLDSDLKDSEKDNIEKSENKDTKDRSK